MKSQNLSNDFDYLLMARLFILFVFLLFVALNLVYLLEPNLSSRLSALYVLGCHQRWSSCFSSQAPLSWPARAFYYYNKREAGHLELWSMEEGLPTANLVHLPASKQEGIHVRDSNSSLPTGILPLSSSRNSGDRDSSPPDINLTWAVIIIIIMLPQLMAWNPIIISESLLSTSWCSDDAA